MSVFLKERLYLVILLPVATTLLSGALIIQEILYAILTATFVLLSHGLLHELGHAIAARLCGFKVSKFTLNRVYVEDEPSSFEEIRKTITK